MNDHTTPEPNPEKIAAALAPFNGGDPDTIIHVRSLIATAIREERTRQHKIQAAYVLQIARALAGEFTPLVARTPDWRNIHSQLISASFTLDPPAHIHAPDTGRWAGCRACSLGLPEGD